MIATAFRPSRLISATIVVFAMAASLCQGQDEFTSVVQPFLKQHCVRCHGAKKQESDLRLDILKADLDSTKQAAVWIEVMDNLNLGQMPPADELQPDAAVHQKVVRWISAELKAARKRASGVGGLVLLRRLNRTEFSNTIRDLFSMRFLPGEDPSELLPPDPTYDGFDKVGSMLMLDPSLLAGYYEAARRIASKAIVTGPPKYPTRRTRFEWEDMAKPSSGLAFVCGHGGMDCRKNDVSMIAGSARAMRELYYPGTKQMFPATGFYTIRIRASADMSNRKEPLMMAVQRVDGRGVDLMRTEVSASPDAPQVYSVTRPMVALPEAGGVYMRAGLVNGSGTRVSFGLPRYWQHLNQVKEFSQADNHGEALRLKARMKSEGWTGGNRPAKVLLDPGSVPNLILDWIEIEGPLYDGWPPRSHKALFFKGEDTPKDLKYAREMFSQFLPRAFRRPVEDIEVQRVVKLVRKELERGVTFEDAVKVGLSYVLTSPAFLYIVESNAEKQSRKLTDYELASRLSYFLWSSMPDERLFKLTASGRLRDPKVFASELDRMIADPKSRSLVDGFAAQWLRTDGFLEFTPDRKIYREFDPALREHMVGETHAFFEEIRGTPKRTRNQEVPTASSLVDLSKERSLT
jgi:hypothetical protein